MTTPYHFFPFDREKVFSSLEKKTLIEQLKKMLLIRNFEIRAEAAYQQGKVGGFFHSYIGQEAVQVAAVLAFGKNQWYTTTYRCHALALLLGVTPKEIMAELYGKATGNAKGRGGSMHLYASRMTGGFGIVGGHLPIATGTAFAIQYKKKKDEIAVCFMGEGAVAQGAFHESLNLASLWNLPCVYVIENNQWGMGTRVDRAICDFPIAEKQAKSYGIDGYTLDGMDFFSCYAGFSKILSEVLEKKKPVLVEVLTQRFKGHSISDPALYRTKDELKHVMEKDPILLLKSFLIEKKLLSEEEFTQWDKENKQTVVEAMEFAEKSPTPDPSLLEEDVLAPETAKGIIHG